MRYAAYGSNLHPVRLRARTPSAQFIGVAEVAGLELTFAKRSVDGSGKCTVLENPGSTTHVAIYEIEDGEIQRLDRIEGVGSGYEVRHVQVSGMGGVRTYVASRDYLDHSLSPYVWYRELVLVGCESLGFPARYTDAIRTRSAARDPDCSRHDTHMEIVRKARGVQL